MRELGAKAARESQMRERVDLILAICALEMRLTAVVARLG